MVSIVDILSGAVPQMLDVRRARGRPISLSDRLEKRPFSALIADRIAPASCALCQTTHRQSAVVHFGPVGRARSATPSGARRMTDWPLP